MDLPILCNIHRELKPPTEGTAYIVGKSYEYYHYLIDGVDDRGWGCGYRTLQTICSWVNLSTEVGKQSKKAVPSLREIQDILVTLGDKESDFAGSKRWIGSFEVFLVLEKLYGIASKIIHVKPGSLDTVEIKFLKDHFIKMSSPVMMGGDVDNASKCILGIIYENGFTTNEIYLLVLDPHFVRKEETVEHLQKEGWISWKRLSDFDQDSFYNFCLPQIAIN